MQVIQEGTGPGHPDLVWGDPAGSAEEEPKGTPPAGSEELEEVSREQMREVHQQWFARSDTQEGCGRRVVPLGNPSIHQDDEGRCYLRGVQRCGSAWACPVCARAEAIQRSEEIEGMIRRHQEAGGTVAFVTLTLPHHAGHTCEDVREAVSESWGYMLRGSPWRRWDDRLGYVGQIRALETTHGPHGWHWHVHALLFLDDLPDRELDDAWVRDDHHRGGPGPGGHWRPSLLCWMRDRWARRIRTWYLDDGELERMNLSRGDHLPEGVDPAFGEPNRHVGVRMTAGDADAGTYLGKMGLGRELSAIDLKRGHTAGHRTPFQILRDVCRSWREEDRRLWQSYVDATAGRAQVYTSPAVRARYETDEQLELEDQVDDDPEPEDDLLLEVRAGLWRLCSKMVDAFDVKVVRRAEAGGARAVVDWLQELVDRAGTGEVVAYSEPKRYCWLREPRRAPPPDGTPGPGPQSDLWDEGVAA